MTVRNLSTFSPIAVTREYLNATDPRVGLVPNLGSNQGAAIQAGIDLTATASRGGALFFPPGEYINNTAELQLPANRSITLLGAGGNGNGNAATVIRNNTDFGTDEYALKNTSSRDCQVEKIAFVGPSTSSTVGTFPANMGGIYVINRLKLVDVSVTGYAWGLGIIEDHQEFHRCDLRGNGYGIYWIPGTDGLGDQYFNRIDCRDSLKASLAISSSGQIGNALFLQCLFGNSPFAIMRPGTPGGTSTRSSMSSVAMVNCNVEPVGVGFFYDEIGDSAMDNWEIIGGTMDGYGGPTWASYTRQAWIVTKTLDNFFMNGPCPPYVTNGTPANQVPIFKIKTLQNARLRDPGSLIDDIAAGNAHCSKLVSGGQFTGGHNAVEVGGVAAGGQRMAVYGSSGTISKGEAVMRDDWFQVKKHTGLARDRVIGVAMHDVTSGNAVHVWTGGQGADLKVKVTSGTVNNGMPIKADTSNAGSFVEASSVADANCVGRALATGTGPTTVLAELFL